MNTLPKQKRPHSSVYRAAIDAREIITAAKAEGTEIIANAQLEAKRIRESAYQEGVREASVRASNSILSFIETEKSKLYSSDEVIFELAMRVAKDVALTFVELDKASLLKRIQRALSLITATSRITLVVNPSDAFLLDQGETQLRTHCDSSTVLNFKIDENLTVGSARIETRSAKILLDPKAHLCRYSESLKRVSRIAQ